jgi:Tuberculosis necrotizing toxin
MERSTFRYDRTISFDWREEAAHAFIKGKFGNQAELVYGGPGKGSSSGDFDQVWKVTKPDGSIEYVVVEAKGGSAQLGSREVGDPTHRFQQGTSEYFESVRANMGKDTKSLESQSASNDLRTAIRDGQVRYIHVETPIMTDPVTGKASVGNTKVREFDLTAKPVLDPTTTPANPSIRPPTNEPNPVNPAGVKPEDIVTGTTTPKPVANMDITPNTKNLSDIDTEQVARLQKHISDPAELESWLALPGARPEYLERLFAICKDNDVPIEKFKNEWAMRKPTEEELKNWAFKWPDNNGALKPPEDVDIPAGELIDRYGATKGSFVSPSGTANLSSKTFDYSKYSHSERALPSTPDESNYHVYLIVKPIAAEKAIAAPWFGEPGGATQYKFKGDDVSVQQYLDSGHLIEIPVSKLKSQKGTLDDTTKPN